MSSLGSMGRLIVHCLSRIKPHKRYLERPPQSYSGVRSCIWEIIFRRNASVQRANVIMSHCVNEVANVETRCLASPSKKCTAENTCLPSLLFRFFWARSSQASAAHPCAAVRTPTNSVRHPAIASSLPCSSARAPEIGRTATPKKMC